MPRRHGTHPSSRTFLQTARIETDDGRPWLPPVVREAFSADMRYYALNDTFMHTRPEFEPIRKHPLLAQLMRPTN